MKKYAMLLAVALVGCGSDSDHYNAGLRMVEEYKKANNCQPIAFKLADKSYEFCSVRHSCSNFSYQYFKVEYQCKDGKKLYTELKAP